MHMHWTCPAGHVVHGDGEDQIVMRAQEHMQKEHGKDILREEVLRTAHAHQH